MLCNRLCGGVSNIYHAPTSTLLASHKPPQFSKFCWKVNHISLGYIKKLLFSIFFIENKLFTENVKKGETAVTNRTVERFNLHS